MEGCRAVLPVAWAFSVTGITAGFLIMVVVASANAFTCDLLLRQALVTGTLDYESLGLAVGGPAWRVCLATRSHSLHLLNQSPKLNFFS